MFDQPIDNEEVSKKQAKLFEHKKKYKHLESDKKAYVDESVKVIKKQKTNIDSSLSLFFMSFEKIYNPRSS